MSALRTAAGALGFIWFIGGVGAFLSVIGG